ncbi:MULTISPECIES: hypothetical protein [Enterobacteriaceae]|uniref:hypothetical protein n=1 Tax=Enterobacteriaceae TaxID=543 RepID=UPI002E2A76ED|nr:hypothetical protein [Klebsiella pneumoniae]MED6004894.1 hypothetical protein [Klebsiella pneumoniae]MED6058292.1 hypothetical protein [Klebsiella pneumoniae]
MKKSLILAASVALAACSNKAIISGPYEVESVDLVHNVAAVKTGDLVLEVEFEGRFFKDGNGFTSWNDVEVNSINDVKVFNEDGETEDYVLPSEEVSNIVQVIEKEIAENM